MLCTKSMPSYWESLIALCENGVFFFFRERELWTTMVQIIVNFTFFININLNVHESCYLDLLIFVKTGCSVTNFY